MICTLYGSNDVFCFAHVPFQGLEPSNGGLRLKNTNISTRFWTSPIFSRNRFSIRALESKLHLNVKNSWLEVTNHKLLSHTCGPAGSAFISRWLPPPWISNNYYHFKIFFLIWWESCESSTKRNCYDEKRLVIKIQDGGCCHFELKNTVAISLIFDQPSPHLVGCCEFDVGWICLSTNRRATQKQDNVWRQLKFQKRLRLLYNLTSPY